MASKLEAARKLWYDTFVRDEYKCVYCGKDLLGSLDDFAASHLDHLKPVKCGGGDDPTNCVIACSVCNGIKGDFDPSPSGAITSDTFDEALQAARRFVQEKREGKRECSYVNDYNYWLRESGRRA